MGLFVSQYTIFGEMISELRFQVPLVLVHELGILLK